MGKCQKCGNTGILLHTIHCKICGKEICDDCKTYLFRLETHSHIGRWKWYACSEQCLESLARKVIERVSPNEIDISKQTNPDESLMSSFVKRTVLSPENESSFCYESEKYKKIQRKELSEGKLSVSFAPPFDAPATHRNVLMEKLKLQLFSRPSMLAKVKNLVTARRYEDAAQLYERLGMYEKAGEIRARREVVGIKEITVKKIEVSVDLNRLLKQLKDGGLVIVYRCPHCNAPLEISKDTNVESLRVCEHCGSEIETVDVADFLKAALS